MRVEESKRISDMSKGGAKFSGPEWDEARRKHKEKIRAKADGASTN